MTADSDQQQQQRPALQKRSSLYHIEKKVVDGRHDAVPCKCVKHLTFCYEDWEIPPCFDVCKSTTENYGAPGKKVLGAYADIREQLDFSYHGNYCPKRQLFQDTLIRNVVGAAVAKEGPWIVFTAGAMGAGKSHVIQWMSDRGYFPLPDIVQIDPDLFKIGFPEWDAYVQSDPLKVSHDSHAVCAQVMIDQDAYDAFATHHCCRLHC